MTDLIWSPRLEKNIGYVWVPIELAGPATSSRSWRRTAGAGRRGRPRIPFLDPRKTVPLG